MLDIALPHASAWNSWFTGFDNGIDGYRKLRDEIDAACSRAGRAPEDVERTVALLVRFADLRQPDGTQGRPEPGVEPIDGAPETLAAALRAFAAEGVGHVQLVLEPITLGSIEALGPTLAELDA
jgi:alkanesulfonate monooxygenase SsuD/methylene tetrahydromethanopterin reductase-like flavin-dependent oxidoreductase (luciferase family)